MSHAQVPAAHPLYHRIVTSAEAIAFIKANGLTLRDFNLEYQPPGRSVLVYPLPEGEIVVIEARARLDYPAIIFKTIAGFEQCIALDSFPVALSERSWLEINAHQIKHFLEKPSFYAMPLEKYLGIKLPFQSVKDCELAYAKVKTYVNDSSNSINFKDNIGHCFSLAMTQYFVEKENYAWYFKKEYNIYNPFYNVFIVKQYKGYYFFSNINDIASSCMRLESSASFEEFYRRVIQE